MSEASQIWYNLNQSQPFQLKSGSMEETATSFTPIIPQVSLNIGHLVNSVDKAELGLCSLAEVSFPSKILFLM